ncbi:MAG: transcriptional regulator [Rubrobacteraceae bacterium]
MAEPFEELASLDRLIHEPARLAIMTALSASEGADFLFLQRVTGLTKGNLSSHLTKLEKAGLVKIKKRFVGKTPNTFVSLTKKGRVAIEEHWEQLERLRSGAKGWKPRA